MMQIFNRSSQHHGTVMWFIFFVFQAVVFFGTMYLFDGFNYIWEMDRTKLSFVIMIFYLLGTMYMGCRIYKREANIGPAINHGKTNGIWFVADQFLSLGMIGTVIGFIIMLTSIFSVDLSDSGNYSILITNMLVGMGTALWTTLVGLITSMMLKNQIVYYESKVL
jgi:hypothetical protein